MNRTLNVAARFPRADLLKKGTLETCRRDKPQPARAFAGLRWLFAAWVATALLFAHGCHGPDEDHELSVLPIECGDSEEALSARGERVER